MACTDELQAIFCKIDYRKILHERRALPSSILIESNSHHLWRTVLILVIIITMKSYPQTPSLADDKAAL